MNNNDKRNNKEKEIEDTTKYGEFISSFFSWITPEEQKERAKHLEDLKNKKE